MSHLLEIAESIPFNRRSIAHIVNVPPSTLNNWLDRNDLWAEESNKPRRQRVFRFNHLIDIGGFSAMRMASIPEKDCAKYVRNFGFYRRFIHKDYDDGVVKFGIKDHQWAIGFLDPLSEVTLGINIRVIGSRIFLRLSETVETDLEEWPPIALKAFRALYQCYQEYDIISRGSAPLWDVVK